MGRDKALLKVNGSSVSLMLAERYAKSLGPVAFSVDRTGRFPHGSFTELVDAYPGQGPFNGLYSAFTKTAEDCVFLTATDMPNGDPGLVHRLAERMGGHDICTIRRKSGYIEPLFAIYHRRSLPLVKECLEEERLSLLELYRELDVLAVPEEELPEWDLDKVLFNINTCSDYDIYLSKIEPGEQNVSVEPMLL
jgi:molybdopterin-guanine dinucleotide biosynthesis protein A